MATQSKNKAAPSISIDSQATNLQDLIDNPDSNTDAGNDVALQVIYSSIIDTSENTADVNNEEPVLNLENDAAQTEPADAASTKIHDSLALNSEPISDTPIDDENANPDIISSIENDETLAPIDNLDSDSDQILIAADETAVVVNEQPDVNVSESQWFMSSGATLTMAWVEPSIVIYDENNDTPVDDESDNLDITDIISDVEIDEPDAPIENFDSYQAIIAADEAAVVINEQPDVNVSESVWFMHSESTLTMAWVEPRIAIYEENIDTPIDIKDAVTESFDFSEQPADDYATPVDFIPIEEIVTEDPFIIDDASYDEEFIDEEYNPDGIVDVDIDPVTDPDLIGIDLVEVDSEVIEEETTDDLIDDSMEETIEDYETSTDEIVDEDNYIIDESIDNTTDPLLETTEVTDEPLLIYSYVSSWTTDFTLTFDYQSIPAIEVDGMMNLTVEDTSIELQTEAASDDLTIIPLGLPVTEDLSCITPF